MKPLFRLKLILIALHQAAQYPGGDETLKEAQSSLDLFVEVCTRAAVVIGETINDLELDAERAAASARKAETKEAIDWITRPPSPEEDN